MKYPHPCNQCGFCCLAKPCPVELATFGPRLPGKTCPALSFDGDKAHCGMVKVYGEEFMGIGQGCCIKATAFAYGQQMDFAAMPDQLKIIATRQYRRANDEHARTSEQIKRN